MAAIPSRTLLLAFAAMFSGSAVAACRGGPDLVQSLSQRELLVDADGMPVVFQRSAGTWVVGVDGDDPPPGAERDGIWVFLAPDAWRMLTIDGWRIEVQGDRVYLKLARTKVRHDKRPGRAILVDGTQVTESQEWFETHRDFLAWLERKRRELAAVAPTQPARPNKPSGTRSAGHIWSTE